MRHLTSLSLANASNVSDEGCAAIAQITSLRTLNLKNCPALTDASLAALTPLDRLCHLKLQVLLLACGSCTHPNATACLAHCLGHTAGRQAHAATLRSWQPWPEPSLVV